MSGSSSSSSSVAGSVGDAADERDTSAIRDALESGEKGRQKALDVAALRKNAEKLKKACRAGIPMPQRREVWEALFDLNTQRVHLDYHASKLEIFNGVAHPTHFPPIPDFGSTMKWLNQYIHLTPKRIQQAKAILCVFASTHATLTHCPLLPDLTCVLLIFFDEARTYEYLERMLVRSRQDEYYFTTNGGGFLKWMKTFSILLEQKNPDLYQHMHKTLKLDSAKLFQVWLSRFFIQYMPMRTVFRILDAFLFEGNKILFRVSLAVLKLHTRDLLATRDSHAFLVKLHACMTKQTPTELLAAGFDIYLSRTSHLGKIQTHLDEHQTTLLANPPNARRDTTHFHLPRFTREHDHVSELIGLKELYALWSWLPPSAAICDPILLYSSSIHGYSYQTLWQRACEREVGETTGIFLLFHSSSGASTGGDQVVGMYLNRPLPDPPEWRSRKSTAVVSLYTGASSSSSATTSPLPLDPQSFVFQLKPDPPEAYHHQAWKAREKRIRREEREKMGGVVATAGPNGAHQMDDPHSTSSSLYTRPNLTGGGVGGGGGAGRQEESQSFKPYGIARLEAEIPSVVIASSTAAAAAAAAAAAESSHPASTMTLNGSSFAGGMDAIGSGGAAANVAGSHPFHGLTLHDASSSGGVGGAYANTLTGLHTPHPHSKHHGHGDHSAHHHHHLLGLNSMDPVLSSHSMIVAPSRGINSTQPLNDLFGSLEAGAAAAAAAAAGPSASPSAAGHTLAIPGGPSGRPSVSSAALAAGVASSPTNASAAAYTLARTLASSPMVEPAHAPTNVEGAATTMSLPPPAATSEEASKDEIGGKATTTIPTSQGDVCIAAASALQVLRQTSSHSHDPLAPGGGVGGGAASVPTPPSSQTHAADAREPSLASRTSDEVRAPEAMLLMTDAGFGIVETDGVVLFVSSDLKSAVSGPSTVFASPSFTAGRPQQGNGVGGGPGAVGAKPPRSVLQRGKFAVSTIEVWSFAFPGSDAIEASNPRLQQRREEQRRKAQQEELRKAQEKQR